MVQNRKDFKMVQVPTDSNMADINTKPLGGQKVRYLMNLIGFWHSEERSNQSRRVWEKGVRRQQELCRKGYSDCKDALRFFRVSLGLAGSFLGGLKKPEGVRGRAQRPPRSQAKVLASLVVVVVVVVGFVVVVVVFVVFFPESIAKGSSGKSFEHWHFDTYTSTLTLTHTHTGRAKASKCEVCQCQSMQV